MAATISNSDVISLGMRMVVRVRHEFGCSIDVMSLLHDQTYARSVIDMARRSTSEQLREQGAYLLGFEDPTARIAQDLIDTHAVCIADGRLLLDFGLGQARKAWDAPVYDSAVAPFSPRSPPK